MAALTDRRIDRSQRRGRCRSTQTEHLITAHAGHRRPARSPGRADGPWRRAELAEFVFSSGAAPGATPWQGGPSGGRRCAARASTFGVAERCAGSGARSTRSSAKPPCAATTAQLCVEVLEMGDRETANGTRPGGQDVAVDHLLVPERKIVGRSRSWRVRACRDAKWRDTVIPQWTAVGPGAACRQRAGSASSLAQCQRRRSRPVIGCVGWVPATVSDDRS